MKHMIAAAMLALSASAFTVQNAHAFTPEEQEVLSSTGKAVVAAMFAGTDEAVAECEAGRALISPSSPKYLTFYVERCLAAVVEEGGVKGGKRCAHYERALAAWKSAPPPVDPSDEDTAITRARFFNEIDGSYARDCLGAPAKIYDRNAMAVPPTPGAVLETREGIAYALPAGFGVRSFYKEGGAALLRNPVTDHSLHVARVGLQDVGTREEEYPERETLASGALLDWKYDEYIPGAQSHVLSARLTLPTTYVSLFMTSGGDQDVEKEAALATIREVAGSLRLVGPRQCIGDCGPGVVSTSQ